MISFTWSVLPSLCLAFVFTEDPDPVEEPTPWQERGSSIDWLLEAICDYLGPTCISLFVCVLQVVLGLQPGHACILWSVGIGAYVCLTRSG
jgi:hypothetical protein